MCRNAWTLTERGARLHGTEIQDFKILVGTNDDAGMNDDMPRVFAFSQSHSQYYSQFFQRKNI